MSYKISRNRVGNELLYDKIKYNGKWEYNYLGKISHYSKKTLTEEFQGDNLKKSLKTYNKIKDETELILEYLENNIAEYILSIKKEIYFPPYSHAINNDDYFVIKEKGIYRQYDNVNLIAFDLDYNKDEVSFPKRGFYGDIYGELMYSYICNLCEVWFKIFLNHRKEVI